MLFTHVLLSCFHWQKDLVHQECVDILSSLTLCMDIFTNMSRIKMTYLVLEQQQTIPQSQCGWIPWEYT